MGSFQQTGEAMLLVQEGQQQMAHAVETMVRSWFSGLKAWHKAMPTTLPPTEFQPH